MIGQRVVGGALSADDTNTFKERLSNLVREISTVLQFFSNNQK